MVLVVCRLTSKTLTSQQLAQVIAQMSAADGGGRLIENRGASYDAINKQLNGALPLSLGYQDLDASGSREHPYTEISRYLDVRPTGGLASADDYIDPVQAHPTVNTRS